MTTRKRIWILGIAGGLSLLAGVWAQDNPGSQTVARPRKKAPGDNSGTSTSSSSNDADLPKIPSKLSPKATKDNEEQTDATFRTETNLVTVDAQVLDQHGNPIPNIPRGNFRILEDNVPQTLSSFSTGEAPLTVAMVIEFSARYQAFYSSGWAQTLNASYGFVGTLRPDDYVAVIAYDLKTTILSDFSNERSKTMEALSRLRIPGFSESNMFDALTDTADRMSKIEGRKAILLIASGIDTFSKLTYDKTRKSLQESGVPVYSISLLQAERIIAEASMGPSQELSFLQADNELKTFAKETGGQAYFPRFVAELPQVFQSLSQSLRNQYTLGFSSNNQAKDGKFRKLTIQLVNPATNEPLRITDQKTGKPIKYTVLSKTGYTAPRAVE